MTRHFPNAPFTVPSYRNADRTRHYGVETGLTWQIPGGVFLRGGEGRDHVTTRVAYTYGRFTYVNDRTYGNNDIPGAPAHQVNAELKCGSVQVDNAAGRFYEPADRRAVYAGLRWSR